MATNIGFQAQPRGDLMARQIADLRTRSDTARQKAVTGLRADPAAALGGKLAKLHDVERALTRNAQYREIISLSQSRAAAIQAALGALSEISVDLQVKAQAALDSPLASASAAVATAAHHGLGAIASALNVSQAGRALFAGDAGAGPALANAETISASVTAILEAAPDADTAYADLAVAFDDPGGVFTTTLYLGGAGNAPATEIAEGERQAYAPRADAPALREMLRDMSALAAAFDRANGIPEDQRAALAERAIGGLRNGAEPMAALAASVGSAEERMADIQARHEAAQAALNTSYNVLAGRDQFEAAAELTALEAQLETTYLTTARLANLSLANFLR